MERKHISLWIDEDILDNCDANQKLTKAKNRGEYFEEALEFYNGYLHNKNNAPFIGKTFVASMQGMIDSLERRVSRLMFKQAVEICKVFWLVVKGFHLSPEDVDDFHLDCVEEVRRINGAIEFPFKSNEDEE